MNRNLLLGIAAAAAASVPVFFQAPAAQAACLTTSSTSSCATFEGSSASTVVNFAYTDGDFMNTEKITRITFNTGPDLAGDYPITLTNIAYSWDGGLNWTTTGLSSTSYTLTAAGQSGADLLGTTDQVKPGGGIIGGTFRLRWTIPAGTYSPLGFGSGDNYIQSEVRTNTIANSLPQTQTRISTPFATPAGTPGPLPLLGAGAAFGLSRRLRQRVRQAV